MRPFLTAEWRYLAMLNYAIDPALLLPYVPPGTELDTWEGTNYVSLVGFLFQDTRVIGVPVPLHRHFEEVNLRFYVRRRVDDGWRRGVVFIREIVPRRAIAAVARYCYNEPYRAMPMRHQIDLRDGRLQSGGSVQYAWRYRGHWNSLRATVTGVPAPLMEGSEAEFIAEHYWGYNLRRDGGATEYQVEHAPWRVWRVSDASLECDIASVYGAKFSACLGTHPRSAFVAEGSPVLVRRGTRLQI